MTRFRPRSAVTLNKSRRRHPRRPGRAAPARGAEGARGRHPGQVRGDWGRSPWPPTPSTGPAVLPAAAIRLNPAVQPGRPGTVAWWGRGPPSPTSSGPSRCCRTWNLAACTPRRNRSATGRPPTPRVQGGKHHGAAIPVLVCPSDFLPDPPPGATHGRRPALSGRPVLRPGQLRGQRRHPASPGAAGRGTGVRNVRPSTRGWTGCSTSTPGPPSRTSRTAPPRRSCSARGRAAAPIPVHEPDGGDPPGPLLRVRLGLVAVRHVRRPAADGADQLPAADERRDQPPAAGQPGVQQPVDQAVPRVRQHAPGRVPPSPWPTAASGLSSETIHPDHADRPEHPGRGRGHHRSNCRRTGYQAPGTGRCTGRKRIRSVRSHFPVRVGVPLRTVVGGGVVRPAEPDQVGQVHVAVAVRVPNRRWNTAVWSPPAAPSPSPSNTGQVHPVRTAPATTVEVYAPSGREPASRPDQRTSGRRPSARRWRPRRH